MFRFLKRKWITGRPIPEDLLRILKRKVPVYQLLPEKYRALLHKRVVVLLDEKHFEGCGGLEMTMEKSVIIAAYAAILILEEKADYYGDLQSILVYPDDYVAPVHQYNDGGIVEEGFESRAGEYWQAGIIVLSWKDIENQLYGEERDSGQNLIYHEFSHFLDDRYGLTAGIDDDGDVMRDDEWTQIIAKAYKRLKFRRGHTFLDKYGATNPAEFFSVATELFFQKPQKLLQENKKLYTLLQNFYGLDPIRWK
ncbi:zinc-dependent peptidase [Rhodohalobacter barkolensis]|uniref:Zinc-dependent peptidase n=1 Tax=Rhodohalobacter barkolensis TaxID=2053187 RepID=A0A2N0VLZ0_9BACT|nr:zinc-dependent peptidase [Rhodohalobacter barkolensis]PKD45227.1 hypothetical protein CWD77_07215 [Rhodohalobacter barkolensis]